MLKTIGRYELLETIGQGGMGTVYKAFDPVIHRTVAVKLISADLGTQTESRERFFREARAAGQLSHRNIVVIYDLGEDAGRPYLAMEYLTGVSLERRLSRGSGLPVASSVDLMIAVCDALEYAHQHGVVHRDIKPGNLFITDSDEVKILDFGLAHLVTSELTRSERIMGTASYMAPEQVRGERVDRRADVFAAGTVLYELLTGHRAFEGDSFANTLYQVLETVPEPVRTYDATIPPPLGAVVERALAKRREDRFQTAGEMKRELVLSREALKPSHRDLVFDSSAMTAVVEPLAPRGSGAAGRVMSDRGRSDARAVAAAAAGKSVVWSPRRVRTTAIVGIVLAVALGSALLLGPRLDTSRESTPDPNPPAADARQPAPQGADATPQAAGEPLPPERAAAPTVVAPAAPDLPRPRRSQDAARPAPAGAVAKAPAAEVGTSGAERAMADAAIARITKAKTLAQAAGAESLAGAAYRSAAGAEDEARSLHGAGEFARAAARATDAEVMYRAAEVHAKAEAAREHTRTADRAAAPAVERQPETPTAPAPAPAAAEPPKAPAETVSVPPESPRANAQQAIREILAAYVAALESRNVGALRAIWPSLAPAQERAIQTEFARARSVQVRLIDPEIDVNGVRATATAVRQYELVTADGQRLASRSRMTIRLRRGNGEWTIEGITFQ